MPDTLRLGTFTPSVLLDVARRTGALAAAQLDVEEAPVASSPAQFQSLLDGEYDAIVTSPDNVIAYRFITDNPLGRRLDVVVTAALDRGLGLTLCARPGLSELRTDRPLRLGVDVPNSGFALLAYELLDRLGVARDGLALVALGSTPKRATALLARECDVTILNAGNELTAIARGAHALADTSAVGPFLGAVLARREAGPRTDAADRLARVFVDVGAGIARGAFASELAEAARDRLSMDSPTAQQHAEVFASAVNGAVPTGAVDAASLATLLTLRRRWLPSTDLDGVESRIPELLVGLAAGG